jgi:hypothetical protein
VSDAAFLRAIAEIIERVASLIEAKPGVGDGSAARLRRIADEIERLR